MIYIALLRAVNVSGRAAVPMAELRELCEELGFDSPRTLLHSGNLVFRGERSPSARLEALFEDETEKRFGHRPDCIVRTAAEWRTIVAGNPFPRETARNPAQVFAFVLKAQPVARDLDALRAAIKGPESIQGGERVAYAVYPAGMGASKLTNAVIERGLKTRGTARNWNTVCKIAALVADLDTKEPLPERSRRR